MTHFSILRSRPTGTLATADGAAYAAGVDAFSNTIRHGPDALVRGP